MSPWRLRGTHVGRRGKKNKSLLTPSCQTFGAGKVGPDRGLAAFTRQRARRHVDYGLITERAARRGRSPRPPRGLFDVKYEPRLPRALLSLLSRPPLSAASHQQNSSALRPRRRLPPPPPEEGYADFGAAPTGSKERSSRLFIKESFNSPPPDVGCLCFSPRLVPIVHPRHVLIPKPPPPGGRSLEMSETLRAPRGKKKKVSQVPVLKKTASSGDTDTSAGERQLRPKQNAPRDHRGSLCVCGGAASNQLSDSLRFKKKTKNGGSSSTGFAAELPRQWEGSHVDLTLCDCASK